jgi:hypothetical protein
MSFHNEGINVKKRKYTNLYWVLGNPLVAVDWGQLTFDNLPHDLGI